MQIDWLDYIQQVFQISGQKITEEEELVVFGMEELRNIVYLVGNTSTR